MYLAQNILYFVKIIACVIRKQGKELSTGVTVLGHNSVSTQYETDTRHCEQGEPFYV